MAGTESTTGVFIAWGFTTAAYMAAFLSEPAQPVGSFLSFLCFAVAYAFSFG